MTAVLLELISGAYPASHLGTEPGLSNWNACLLPLRHHLPSRQSKTTELRLSRSCPPAITAQQPRTETCYMSCSLPVEPMSPSQFVFDRTTNSPARAHMIRYSHLFCPWNRVPSKARIKLLELCKWPHIIWARNVTIIIITCSNLQLINSTWNIMYTY